ncbi:MAG: hypothetical protein JOZ46_02820 [Candidatus Dormibacteraeota bacterium]|nr:hypothetical protein [Candidatus Dormibacteraeota bacterium]MBV9524732.1 hypothetical protein [Candidatus Dormibacteraeota bacterium]
MERWVAVTDIGAQAAQDDLRDDWFGEGTAFNSQADLAAALHAMTEQPAPTALPESEAQLEDDRDAAGDGHVADGNGHVPDGDVTFELMEHRALPLPPPVASPPVKPQPRVDAAVATWSVRVPGVQLLPQRQPGRSGWSLQNSVRILRQADELVVRLREEAIVTTFSATARALRGGDGAAH